MSLLVATAFLTGCNAPDTTSQRPPLPPQLVAHAELPFGDAVNARITRASTAVRDLLEPRWGALESRIYTVPAARRGELLQQFPATLPPGFTMLDMRDFPEDRGTLHAFANGKTLYALLLVKDAGETGDSPAVLFDNLNSPD